MKKLQITKKIVSSLAIALVLAVNPIVAHAEWKQDSTGWWYAEGDSWYKGWKQIGEKWYYFKDNGYMAHDCYIDNYSLNSKGYWDGALQSQDFSVNYPSSWIKAKGTSGMSIYLLGNEFTIESELTVNMQGKSRDEVIDKCIKAIKSRFGINQVNISQQMINGRTVDVFDYKYKLEHNERQVHTVNLYNNDKLYVFTIVGDNGISSANMDAFNNMLKTITF
ncbi:hypothetical protein [Clostridium diolis]|uniref:hypothetical protein n=1 Tax=Clostridium diolis TaxID=223919 RepID=UPI003AF92EE0